MMTGRRPRDAKLTRRVEEWFRENARDLPWRSPNGDRDPYACLVAEFMLQQTQVSRVVDRFVEFLSSFPTVEDLAAADEQDVLAHWQGLGYYRRARNLHAAARMIVIGHGGCVPEDPTALRALPGVGPYIAGSLGSIVFHRRAALVDGNVKRVLARWFAHDHAPSRETDAWCWETAERLVGDCDDPAAFNEGLMELGATVCTPRNPDCASCPVRTLCLAFRSDRTNEIPPPRSAATRQTLHHHTVVIQRRSRVLFEQRSSDGLWSGLWQPPTVESDRELDADEICAILPFNVTAVSLEGRLQRTLTHRSVHFHVYRAQSRVRRGRWQPVDQLSSLPMSAAHRAALDVVLTGR